MRSGPASKVFALRLAAAITFALAAMANAYEQTPSDSARDDDSHRIGMTVTLDILAVSDRRQAERTSAQIGQLLTLPVRLVSVDGTLRLRAGVLTDYATARQYADQLQASGFPQCHLEAYRSDESVLATYGRTMSIPSPQMKGSASNMLDRKRRSDEIPAQALDPYGTLHSSRAEPPLPDAEIPEQPLIEEGWELLKSGRLDNAQLKFEQSAAVPSLKRDAQYGLAHVAFRRRQYAEAVALLEKLAEQHFRRHQTLPLLTAARFELRQWDRAAESARLIPDAALREHWTTLIAEMQVRADLGQTLDSARIRSGPGHLSAALQRNQAALTECRAPDLFFRLGQALVKAGQQTAGLHIFERLLSTCHTEWGLRKGILHLLVATRPDDASMHAVNRELARRELPPSARQDLARLRLQLLRTQAGRLQASDPKQGQTADALYREILRDHPDDKVALSALAWAALERGNSQEAVALFERLRRAAPDDPSPRKGLALSLLKSGQLDEAQVWASQADDPALLLTVLHAQLAALPQDSDEVPTLAQKIISLKPDDRATITTLAWWHFRRGDFKAGELSFRQILALSPHDANATEGLVNTLVQQNKLDAALSVIASNPTPSDPLKAIQAQIYRRKAELASNSGNNAEAERDIREVASLTPDDPATEEWLGWAIYRQGDKQRAIEHFRSLYARHPSVGAAAPLLGMLEESGDVAGRESFLDHLAQNQDSGLRRLAAQRRFAEGDAIRAAVIDDSAEAPYANADSAWGGADFFYRERFGDVGTYRLHQIGARLSFVQPATDGTVYGVSFIPQDLSSGRAATGPSADPLWISNQTVMTPYFSVERPGRSGFRVALGTTPLNGPVAPMPMAEAQIQEDNWFLGAHQLPVNQTMLSFIGQRTSENPRHPWGRVLRSGLVGGKTFLFNPGYWLSLSARYDYYWGENVWANHAVDGTLSAGKSFYQEDGNWSVGWFMTNMHYSHNTNFFTYGHGGYYSPNWMLVTGPTASYELHPRTDYWVKADSSVNWFRTDESASPAYPLGGGSAAVYPGNTHSGIGYFFQLQGRQLLTPYLDWGVDVRYLRSAAFSDWNLIFGIRAFLEPHNSPWPLPTPVPQVYAAP